MTSGKTKDKVTKGKTKDKVTQKSERIDTKWMFVGVQTIEKALL